MTASVPSSYAAWLQADARYRIASVVGAAAKWGTKGVTSTIISPFAFAADAGNEATRQAQFLAGPMARDTFLVPGQRRDLVGKPIQAQGDRLGYAAQSVVFVIGADETSAPGYTRLTVLKRL